MSINLLIRLTVFALGITFLGLGCKSRSREVVVYTSVDQVFSEPILRTFEKKSGIGVRAVYDTEETKSTGVVNRLIAEANRPQADIFWSNDPVRQLLLIRHGLVEPYLSPAAAGIPSQYRASDGSWTGFAARARILLVNLKRLATRDLPRSVLDLIDPRWKGEIAIANPLFGTTTMHVAALFSAWGEDRARAFMRSLKGNGVRIASSNGEVKRLVVAGEITFGLCDTDDGNEALKEGAPVRIVYPDQDKIGTLVMPTTVVMLRNSPHARPARRLIDYLLNADVEKAMSDNAAHMPLRLGIPTPRNVRPVITIKAMKVDYAKIAAEMERIQPWLRKWVGL